MALSQYAIKNFWNEIRVEKNIRYKDLAELFPNYRSQTTVAWWFSGQLMPKDNQIKTLCDLFDVDFETGKAEFEKAHAVWESTHHCGERISTGESERTNYAPRGDGNASMMVTEGASDAKMHNTDIFALIYGKVDYPLFRKFCELVGNDYKRALELIYGRVTYDEFIIIQNIVKEVQ